MFWRSDGYLTESKAFCKFSDSGDISWSNIKPPGFLIKKFSLYLYYTTIHGLGQGKEILVIKGVIGYRSPGRSRSAGGL